MPEQKRVWRRRRIEQSKCAWPTFLSLCNRWPCWPAEKGWMTQVHFAFGGKQKKNILALCTCTLALARFAFALARILKRKAWANECVFENLTTPIFCVLKMDSEFLNSCWYHPSPLTCFQSFWHPLPMPPLSAGTEEPMSHIVALAAAEVSENPAASSSMRQFAAVRQRDAETGACKVLEKLGLKAPIPIDRLSLGEEKWLKNFPCMKFSSWLAFLLKTGRVPSQLCGCSDMYSMTVRLAEFWTRYEQIHPTHEVFQMSRNGLVDLKYLIPTYTHTDEGRSVKKLPLWILSVHGALGRGTNAWLRKGKDKVPLRRNGLGLPFVGPTWSNHFMFSCMLRTKKFFKKDPKVLDDLVLAFAEDMQELLLNGVTTADGRITIRCCHLGTKGDLPALAKLGRMKHTFSNCPRASTTKNPCEGICWMCLGGQEETADGSRSAVPFEEMSGQPLWEATLGQQDNWDAAPPILHGVPLVEGEQWSFFKTDVWHNFHLGVAKHWLASAFVCAIETLPFLGHLSVDDQISWLDARYKEFYKRKKISPHVTEIGRDTLSWPQSSTCPIGNWNKGAASTHFMQFLESLCTQYKTDFANDDLLDTIASWMDFEKFFYSKFCQLFVQLSWKPWCKTHCSILAGCGHNSNEHSHCQFILGRRFHPTWQSWENW